MIQVVDFQGDELNDLKTSLETKQIDIARNVRFVTNNVDSMRNLTAVIGSRAIVIRSRSVSGALSQILPAFLANQGLTDAAGNGGARMVLAVSSDASDRAGATIDDIFEDTKTEDIHY